MKQYFFVLLPPSTAVLFFFLFAIVKFVRSVGGGGMEIAGSEPFRSLHEVKSRRIKTAE